jgi:SAM-dependent methyltransferase
MTGLYRSIARYLSDRWCGGLHAGLIVKGVHLQWRIRPYLKGPACLILDAGSGEGAPLTVLLARRYREHRFEAWNLYMDEPEVDASRRRLSLSNLSTRKADLLTLDAQDGYDLIFSIDVLEHIEAYEEVLKRFVRALRPGGRLLLHVPSLYASDHGEAKESDWSRYRPHRPGDDHVRDGFDMPALKHQIEGIGLQIVRAGWTFGPLTNTLAMVYRRAERSGVRGIGIALALPVTVAALGEILLPPSRGGGLWLEAVKGSNGVIREPTGTI